MKTKFDISAVRADFPALTREVYGKPLVYLDNGATAQKPRQVIAKTDDMAAFHNANVHRAIHRLSVEATQEYEAARETVCRFINAASTREVIFTSGATESINTIAYSFSERFIGAGDNVIVSEMEHHSNIVPWQIVAARKGASIKVLPVDEHGRLMVEKLPELIDGHTRIIAVTQASNVLGTMPDLAAVISLAHSAGVPVLVDGCQGIVHGGADVQQMDCDFYVFSGHKLYGPTGTGVLYGKRKWLEQLPPFMGGGDMVATVSFAGTTYAELPLRFEAGTANYIGAVGLAEAIRYMESFNAKEIEAHEQHLLSFATEGLSSVEGVKIYGTQPGKCPIISFCAEGVHPTDIGMILDKMGVAVRTGTHCAEPLMQRYGVTGMCRASFAMYNTVEEADAFVRGVERAVRMLRQ